MLLRDDKKAEKSSDPSSSSRPIENESINNRVATIGVKFKPSAEHLIPTLFRYGMRVGGLKVYPILKFWPLTILTILKINFWKCLTPPHLRSLTFPQKIFLRIFFYLFRWRVAPPTRRSVGADPRRQVKKLCRWSYDQSFSAFI